jgi:hypothetical protein
MRKSVRQAPTAGEQTQQKPWPTSSDIGAEQKIILSDEIRRRIGKGLKKVCSESNLSSNTDLIRIFLQYLDKVWKLIFIIEHTIRT